MHGEKGSPACFSTLHSHNKIAHQLFPIQQISPDIIGGLVVEIGDRTIDYSVSAKIAKMNKMLTDIV